MLKTLKSHFIFYFEIFFFFYIFGLSLRSVWAAEEELEGEVKTEVLFKPEECSQRSKRGDLINAHYDGYLAKDGSQFYCSRTEKDGHPQWFVLGVGQVIKGLDIGMMDMCPGEKRKITVPSALAFGEQGKGKSMQEVVGLMIIYFPQGW
uniref:peptidylprolyl isomerase n=1 Tax=Amphilophus citrinellus TaxID=61819 RepID=A0A3Q0RBQ2_AMPCI